MSLPNPPLLNGDISHDIEAIQRYLFVLNSVFVTNANEAVAPAIANLPNGTVTTDKLADNTVTYVKIQQVTESRLLGRGEGNSDGEVEEIIIGDNGLSLTGTVLDTSQVLDSGTYTPTVTILTNLDAVVINDAQYLRVGNVVTVSGRVQVDATTAAFAQFTISLPIASAFTAASQCGGVAFCPNVASLGASIQARTANGTALLAYVALDVVNRVLLFTFTYLIVA